MRVASLSHTKTNLVFGCRGNSRAGIAEEVLSWTPAAPLIYERTKPHIKGLVPCKVNSTPRTWRPGWCSGPLTPLKHEPYLPWNLYPVWIFKHVVGCGFLLILNKPQAAHDHIQVLSLGYRVARWWNSWKYWRVSLCGGDADAFCRRGGFNFWLIINTPVRGLLDVAEAKCFAISERPLPRQTSNGGESFWFSGIIRGAALGA